MLFYFGYSVILIFSLIFFLFSLLFFIFINFLFKNNKLLFKMVNTFYKFSIFLSTLSLVCMISFGLTNFMVIMMANEIWLSQGPSMILDMESYLFIFMSSYVSWNIMRFGMSYMVDESKTLGFVFMLIVFMALMLILVLSCNFLFLFLGWEGVSLLSYILISWWFGRSEAVGMGMQAVIYNRVSDFSLLFFMAVALYYSLGLSMSWTQSLYILFILFFVSVMAKSSQFLFHPWLPNAMEGPTPVSSLLHSSTMVVASVLLIIRCYDLFFFSSSVFFISTVTCLFSGMVAASQFDVKKIIAYSTTSQLGFMLVIVSLSFKELCIFYMVIHSFFKAMMFMISGGFIHGGVGTQDSRMLSSSVKSNKLLMYMMMVSAVVMMSFPFLSAFWFKDFFMENITSSFINRFMVLILFLSLMYTVIYNTRLLFGVTMITDVSSYKLVVQQGIMSVIYMYGLMTMSLIASLYLWSVIPLYEINMNMLVKFWPLVGLILSFSWVYYLLSSMNILALYSSMYMRYYNPILHKMLSRSSYFFSSKFYLMDYIVFEFMFPYLLKKKFLYPYLFVILFLGLMLC